MMTGCESDRMILLRHLVQKNAEGIPDETGVSVIHVPLWCSSAYAG